jgi:hypothetical protein
VKHFAGGVIAGRHRLDAKRRRRLLPTAAISSRSRSIRPPEPPDGQLPSGSFVDYAMPRAADVPLFAFSTHDVPSAANPLGANGAGEVPSP